MAGNVLGNLFGEIADAIRSKTGDTATMKPAEFPEKISGIEAGGGSSERTVIMEEKTVDGFRVADAGFSVTQVEGLDFTVNAGGTYTVLWDGQEYKIVAQTVSEGGSAITVLGNLAILDMGSDTGEPFFMYSAPAGTEYEGQPDTTMYATNDTASTSHTIGIYQDGGSSVTTVETSVDLDFSLGDMEVTPNEGEAFSKVTIPQPEALVAENIAEGITVAGIVGTLAGGGGSACRIDYTVDDDGNIIGATPYGFTELPNYAFATLTNLQWVDLSNCPNLTSLGENTFRGCSSLTSFAIPDGITSIELSTFYQCSALTSITIPDGVTSIGNYAFYQCSSLQSIYIPNGVTSIGESAFRGCTSLTSITIPDRATSISSYAFYQCSALTDITIPDNVTSIGYAAFQSCTSLTSITIPDGVTSAESMVFAYCTSLKSVIFSDGATCNITNGMFSNCTALTSVIIGENITKIEWFAFSNATALTTVRFRDTSSWYRTTSSSYTNGTYTSVSNTSTAATYLRDTYAAYFWYKV